MAGATSKTSVKSTVTKKAAKTTTVKSSKATKTTAKAAAKSAPEKKTAVKKTTKPDLVAAKTKSTAAKPAVKTASKPKSASVAKTKAAPASKSKSTPEVNASKKPETVKKEVKKTVKAETTAKIEKTGTAKKSAKTVKTTKAAKPTKTDAAVKTTSSKTPSVSKAKLSDTLSKQSSDNKVTVQKVETPVVEEEQSSKPKAKRATKFMTKANAPIIAQLRQQLLQRRNEILSFYLGDLGSANVSSQASGDTADAATDSVHSEMNSQLAEKESQELTDINNALHKMETGEYGLCEECGMPIPIERLEAIPNAELCLKCQEELEEDGEYDNYSYYGYD